MLATAPRSLLVGLVCALLLPLGGFAQAHGDPGPFGRPAFVDATAAAGLAGFVHGGRVQTPDQSALFPEYAGPGACWLDVDGDGWLDVFLVSGKYLTDPARNDVMHPHSRLYRNLGDGTFADVSAAWHADLVGPNQGCAAADYDNDGRPDLVVVGYGGNTLLRNTGLAFEDTTAGSGARGAQCGDLPCWGTSASWLDYDRDGCLDLHVDRYGAYNLSDPPASNDPSLIPPQRNALYRGGCDGTFTEAADGANLTVAQHSWASVAADLDGDGWPDLYVADDGEPNEVWRNDGNGTFHLVDGAAADPRHSMGAAAADLDGDGVLDLVSTNFIRETNGIFLANGDGTHRDIGDREPFRDAEGLSGWAVQAADLQDDGLTDLMVLDGPLDDTFEPLLAYEQLATGWQTIRDDLGLAEDRQFDARGGAWADYDNDGTMDVLLMQAGERPAVLLRNALGAGNFLSLDLVGTGASNRDALGARVTVRAAGLPDQVFERQAGAGFLSSSDPRIHAGLADAEQAAVEVRWPDGQSQAWSGLRANSFLRLQQGQAQAGVLRALPLARIVGPPVAQRLEGMDLRAEDADGAGFAHVSWDLGDASAASGIEVRHAWGDVGTYFVRTTATDPAGLVATHVRAVHVRDALQADVALDATRLLLPTQAATGNVTVRFSNGDPVRGADVALNVTYRSGIAPLDALAPSLPRFARELLGYAPISLQGHTGPDGRFAFTIPLSVASPTGLASFGANRPGHYDVVAQGGARGSTFPDARAAYDVGLDAP